MIQPLLQAADLRGAAQLATDAVAGLTDLVEAMHARIVRLAPPGSAAPDDRTRGLTAVVYDSVRGITRGAGVSAEALFGWLGPVLSTPVTHPQLPRQEREAVVAAINGVLGDHLAATANPLAITMSLRRDGRTLTLERFALRAALRDAGPRPLVLLHGLCMNDLQWTRAGHDHAAMLAREAGWTPVHLHYNTGLSISTNGRILAQLMERLFDAWPVPVQRLALLGHSMGGLVARSALHHATLIQRGALRWPTRVSDLVCLGSPHQGAPLERLGQGVNTLLAATPYAAPLARLGGLRSAGIQDLRHGNIVAAGAHLPRAPAVPLPDHVRCHAIAASLAGHEGAVPDAVGDGLVPVGSALGKDRDPARRLDFDPARQAVVHDTGHLQLLDSPRVAGLLCRWLGGPAAATSA